MEKLLNIHIEKLPEGVYLATSDELQGLVAQGRTVAETLEIARDVARKLLEAQSQDQDYLQPIAEQFNYPLVVGQ
ncbi:type II toxin-antitoxin system HicB family antitoxin [Nostoc sp.]|uniref:type II toxin-antitoxin system HicB family antitoxin n=1 Tax=Nostoc sp. TaxID=1180 RepID=UPI002FF6E62C